MLLYNTLIIQNLKENDEKCTKNNSGVMILEQEIINRLNFKSRNGIIAKYG